MPGIGGRGDLREAASASEDSEDRPGVAGGPALHRDPFDRTLVAQAQIEGMTTVTRDQWIPRYDVAVMAV